MIQHLELDLYSAKEVKIKNHSGLFLKNFYQKRDAI